MSDTIKLIIELPKETYLEIKEGSLTRNAMASAEVIQNGIPLDEVKAEIDRQEFTHHNGLTHWYMTPSEVKSIVFEIIDNICKESEE